MEKLESLIKTYNDFPKKGIAFKDVLTIIQDSEVFKEQILKMSSKSSGKKFRWISFRNLIYIIDIS